METKCISCNEDILLVALFCHKCGSQQKCKSCNTPIVKEANNCIGCGVLLTKPTSSESAMNTFEFNQTIDSRSFRAAFTDKVGTNVVDALKNMLETNHANAQLQKLNSGKSISKDDINQTETIQEFEEAAVVQTPNKTLVDKKAVSIDDIPHIDDVERSLECSEPHWMLIYAFYESSFGKDVFSRDTIQQIYKNNRDLGSRMSNFGRAWDSLFKTENRLMRTIKTGELMLTEKGIETATSLVKGEIVSKPGKETSIKSKPKKKSETAETGKKASKTSAKSVKVEQFDIFKSAKKPALEDFLKERAVKDKNSDLILALGYYIVKFCGASNFSDGNIEYGYKVLKKTPPLHLRQTIINCKTNNMWFNTTDDGKWTLERKGENDFEKAYTQK